MSAARTGLYGTLRQLFDTALELAQVRLALLVSDLEVEKRRLLGVALRALLGLMLLSLGLLLVAGLIVVLLWDSHRLAALVALAQVCFGGGLWLLYAAHRRLRREPAMLATTSGEIERDRTALRSHEHNERA